MKKPPGGYILLVTMITLALFTVFLGLSLELTSSTYRNANRDVTLQQAQALADGCLEVAFAQWKRYVDQHLDAYAKQPPTTNDLAFIQAYPPDQQVTLQSYFANGGFTLNRTTYKVVALGYDSNKNSYVQSDASKLPDQITQSNVNSLATTNLYRYLATAEVTAQAQGGPVTARVSRYFEVTFSPLVQKAIFFENDLEIFPGATMNILGDVHTNANLYAGGTNTLSFYENVTAVGNYANAYATGDGNHTGTPGAPSWSGTGGQSAQLTTPVARQEVLGASPSSITDDIHKLIEIPTSTSNDAAALASRRLYTAADYRILMNSSSSSITVDTINGSVTVPAKGVKVSYGGSGNATTAGILEKNTNGYFTVADATIKDGRQGGNVLLDSVDVNKLSTAIQTNDNLSKTVVYAADVAYSDATQTAIRLKNGASLSQDLTIASQNAVYINGDFNTGTAPPSNLPTAQPPTVQDVLTNDATYNAYTEGTNYDRHSAMVAADAVTILSNNWLDANSVSATRIATPTTVNSAILSGNVATNSPSLDANGKVITTKDQNGNDVPVLNGKYSGGVENFPRFLENWSGIAFTYYGSFIQLYNSKQFKAPWGGTTYYQAPTRRWFFDMRFLKSPPPGLAYAITKQRGAWFRGNPASSSL